MSRRLLPGGLLALATAIAALATAPSALAATDASWTGLSTGSNLWSDAANWGGTAPGTSVGNLTFGDLASCDSGLAPSGASCYSSIDDLGPATVEQLTIGGGQMYQIYPTSYDNPADQITLEGDGHTPNIGMNASPSGSNLQLASFGIPVVLGADQQWNVSGYGIIYMNSISGNHALTLNLDNGYVQANDVENSGVTISGPGELQLDQFAGSPEKLPAVTLNDAAGQESALAVATANATETGDLKITGTDNNFIVLTDHSPGETRLRVDGNVALDSTTNVEFDIDGNNTTPGVDSSQLTSSGAVDLAGAQISLWQAQSGGSCTTLTPGTTYTLISAGSLSGDIRVGGQTVAPGGTATETLSTNMCNSITSRAIVSYGAKTITATIAGPPASAGVAPHISGATGVGDRVTVDNKGAWTGGPAPSYGYQWYSCANGSCSPIGGATGASHVLSGADAGRTVEVRVTASNAYGSASAFSNALGPVKAAATPSVAPALRPRIRADLSRLRHPFGRRAINRLIRRRVYRTRFVAPSSGLLTVVWKATVRTGRGRHARRHTYVIARGHARVLAGRRALVAIHLTPFGRRLLVRHRFSLRTVAVERFLAPRLGPTTRVRRFRL